MSILTDELLESVKTYAQKLTDNVTLAIDAKNIDDHPKRDELVLFLTKLTDVSDQLSLTEITDSGLRSGISFKVIATKRDTGIVFSGIPGGHEFTSLILAILQAGGGSQIKLDPSLQALIKKINKPLRFETFVSLSCHNCPDVVQALNQFALLNDKIASEMIDGGEFQELVDSRGIQGVPAVYLDAEVFANGKIDTAKLVDKLLDKHPHIIEGNDEDAPSLPKQDVLIIGGGPAGVSAAIYAARKGVSVAMVADRIGGQVKDTMDIENFISVPLTTGEKLSAQLAEHLKKHDVTLKEGLSVKSLKAGQAEHQVTLNTGEQIQARTVIIASGANWRELGVPGEKQNVGNGVAYCPHCDGPFFKGKDVAVIGGGNSGVEAALDLSGIVKHVSVLEYMPSLKADKILVDQLKKRDNIDVITNAATQEIIAADGKVNAIRYVEREGDQERQLDLSAVFVQIGLVPNTEFAKGMVEMTSHGEIVINDRCQTSVPGIFACGDATTVPYKQIVVAMGEGSKAALAAFDYLLKND